MMDIQSLGWRRMLALSLLLILQVGAQKDLQADVPLAVADLYAPGAVLQQGQPLPVWGWAAADQPVTVAFKDQRLETRSDVEGRWRVTLAALAADAAPATMTITTPQDARQVTDLLVGEVWLCVGQSNMEWPVSRSEGAAATLAAADRPTIRHVRVGLAHAGEPQERAGIHWEIAAPHTVGSWSAVAYHFALQLQEARDVPVGLINASWGGTLIEPWIAQAGYDAVPAIQGVYRDPIYAQWGDHQVPARLYNAMIHPLAPYGLAGVLWYQGEGNHYDARLYPEKFRGLVESWRARWDAAQLPFYFVQLAPYTYFDPEKFPDPHPNRQVLAEFWEAQARIAATLPGVGMVVINDLGDPKDIHPARKQQVGQRLADLALRDTYGQTMGLIEGPRFKRIQRRGRTLVLSFDRVGDGLASRDAGPLSHFEISADSETWFPATAQLLGQDQVVLEAAGLIGPRAMRFAWHETAMPNLINSAGLPCGAFRAALAGAARADK